MFAKFFYLFAIIAVAFAAPNPKPQVVSYGYDFVPQVAGAAAYPAVVSPYSAYSAPVAYNAYSSGVGAYPVAGGYYFR